MSFIRNPNKLIIIIFSIVLILFFYFKSGNERNDELEELKLSLKIKEKELEMLKDEMRINEKENHRKIEELKMNSKSNQALNRKHRIYDFLRLANYDCLNKGPMIESFQDPIVVEVGSFIGEEFNQFKSAKKLYAFEPTPYKKKALLKNIQDLNMENIVEYHQIAITDITGTVKMWPDCDNKGSKEGCESQQDTIGRPPPWANDEEFNKYAIDVPAKRLDEPGLIKEHINLLKVDTQGHEYQVIKGAERILREDPPDIIHIEFSPNLLKKNSGKEPNELLELIYSHGYKCFDCSAFQPPTITKTNRDISEYHKSFGNYLFRGVDHGAWVDLLCI